MNRNSPKLADNWGDLDWIAIVLGVLMVVSLLPASSYLVWKQSYGLGILFSVLTVVFTILAILYRKWK